MAARIEGGWLDDPRLQAIFTMLAAPGHQAYLVGGAVRNALLAVPVGDIDIATDALPETVLALARQAGLRALATGIAHGTVTVVSDGLSCEITTFRRDRKSDGRHAEVAFGVRLKEDAARRDFTMNALYARADGQVLDPLGQGVADLRAGRVRFIGDAAARIREDYLRSLRFFRFQAWYGAPAGRPDPGALAAISANLPGLETLSRERIGHEMLRLLAAPDPAMAVPAMQRAGVLARILPEARADFLPRLVALERKNRIRPDPLRRLAALGRIGDIQTRLRLSRRDAKRLALLQDMTESPAGLAEIAYRHGMDMARDAALLRAARAALSLAPDWERAAGRGAAARFPLQAQDLAPLQGRALGARLAELEARWIASGFTLTRAELLA